MTESEEKKFLERAERKAKQKIGLYIHAMVFVLVNLFLLILNLVTTPDKLWFYWSPLGWSIGLLIHTIVTYTSLSDLKENLVQKEMEKYKK